MTPHEFHKHQQKRFDMNWQEIGDNWNEVCDLIKVTWGKLDEDDLAVIAGRRDHFVGALQEVYGYEQTIAEDKVDNFVEDMTLQEDGSMLLIRALPPEAVSTRHRPKRSRSNGNGKR